MGESAERKLCEEAGVQETAAKFLGVLDSRLWRSYAKHHIHHNVFVFTSYGDLFFLSPTKPFINYLCSFCF